MNCITILEPWASLIAVGVKSIETRNWPTNVRGRIAIHAGKKFTGDDLDYLLCSADAYHALNDAGLDIDEASPGKCFRSTRGHVIATATLADCIRFTAANVRDLPRNDVLYGDTTPGRYGFVLTDVIRLPEPIPAQGQLGFWEFDPPMESERAA